MDRGDTIYAEAILCSFNFKRLKRIKTEESMEGNEVKNWRFIRHVVCKRRCKSK